MFKPNRSLLNPKFEGYKLDPIPQDDAVLRFNLEYKPTQSTVSGRAPLSFQEVQSRITHNHLAVANHNGRAMYVDAEFRVLVIDIDLETSRPSYRVVHELPKPLQTASNESVHREYPSAAFLTPSVAFVSDGYGSLYLLKITDSGPADSSGTFDLPAEDSPDSNFSAPFRIHNVTETHPNIAVAIISSRSYADQLGGDPSPASKHTTGSRRTVEFDIWAVQFDLRSAWSSDEHHRLDVCWHRRGGDVPIYTSYDSSRQAFLMVGHPIYKEIGAVAPHGHDPSAGEIVPIPRFDENIDSSRDRPPPYSWTQTSDSVTVAFPLPASTSMSNIKVTMTPRTLTLHVQDDSTISIPPPHYSLKAFWDGISSSTSYWTWDREAEHTFGLLTLHLDKQHEGTKWMHVFASAGTTSEDVEVPETLDPSELWKVREALEKYTSALRDGEDASGLGLGKGIPGLAEGELDDEIDASVGRMVYLTWINLDGSTPSWVSTAEETPFSLLSTPLPGVDTSATSLIIKSSLDGTVFTLNPGPNTSDSSLWSHSATFSALAFVLASKRDTRFTYHLPSKAVLAFENGIRDHGGNVYVYRLGGTAELWAKQAILKVGDGSAGALLGVGALATPQGKTVLVCLCEGELVLIRDIF